MLKKLIATAAVMMFVTGAYAAITANFVPVAGAPAGTWVFDIQVTVTDDPGDPDDWTAAGLNATLTSGSFVNAEAFNPPNPPYYGDGMDSYFTVPSQYPNGGAFAGTTFAAGPVETATSRTGEWFDTVNDGAGTYTVNRLAVTEGSVGTVSFDTSAANTLGQLFHYDWPIVPEPASLALIALGALAAIRRR